MSGIIGFELEIKLLEGKFKLGQDRSPEDKQSLLTKLKTGKRPRALPEFTASFFERGKALTEAATRARGHLRRR